jgi:hypothetical protein
MAGNYSQAKEASTKRKIDEQIKGGSGKLVDSDSWNEGYLKELIRLGSGGKTVVSDKAADLQFFIVQGGMEGFLGKGFDGVNANWVVQGGSTTDADSATIIFDYNDMLSVFDAKGKLIDSAQLIRPVSITTKKEPDKWTLHTSSMVYAAWDGQPVSVYRNQNYNVEYTGLWVNDSINYYRDNKARIDLHKQEATNGCVFVFDQDTPPYNKKDTQLLNAFEPRLIKEVVKAVGKSEATNIGTMHMILLK